MRHHVLERHGSRNDNEWLRVYYFLRAGVSIGWIGLAVLAGRSAPPVAAVLLVLYPAWDAAANGLDASRNGGLRSNISQALNAGISLAMAVGTSCALVFGMKPVLIGYGIWAFLAGVLQLATGIRRWKTSGAQWVMILSGGQSALVAAHFVVKATLVPPPGIEAVVPYAGLGAFYFLLSALWLTIRDARRRGRSTIPAT